MVGHVALTVRKQRWKVAVPLTFSFSIWKAIPQDDVTCTRVWSSHFRSAFIDYPEVCLHGDSKTSHAIMNISHHRSFKRGV